MFWFGDLGPLSNSQSLPSSVGALLRTAIFNFLRREGHTVGEDGEYIGIYNGKNGNYYSIYNRVYIKIYILGF